MLRIIELSNGGRVAFDATEERAKEVAEQFGGKVIDPEPVVLRIVESVDAPEEEDFDVSVLENLSAETLLKMFAHILEDRGD